jgi:hypothetical protein
MIIKDFLSFIHEQVQSELPPPRDPEEKVYFQLSDKFLKILMPMKTEYKIAEFYIRLKEGVERKYLSKEPPDYLDVDNEGNISFIKPRFFSEGNVWTSTRRVKMKSTKVLREIYNEAYLDSYIKPVDLESFINKWTIEVKNKTAHVVEYRGEELLRAYNYKNELIKTFGYSCANFLQRENQFGNYREPTLGEFHIYTKNPENCGVAVVWENDVIVARRSFQQGIQLEDIGARKKGEFHTVWGNAYGLGGKYDIMMKDYLKSKYNAVEKGTGTGAFLISMETRFANYCPFDSMYVDFRHNLLTDSYVSLPNPYKTYNWHHTYRARCPAEYVLQREKEEEAKAKESENTSKNIE